MSVGNATGNATGNARGRGRPCLQQQKAKSALTVLRRHPRAVADNNPHERPTRDELQRRNNRPQVVARRLRKPGEVMAGPVEMIQPGRQPSGRQDGQVQFQRLQTASRGRWPASLFSRDAVRAIGVAHAMGFDSVEPQFFLALSRKLTNPAEIVLLAELAKAGGDPQVALRLAKIAFNRDIPVGDYALPVGVIPEFRSLLTDRVDPALVHALSRQESEFNAAAKSPVGASGLMQLMPNTAKAVAKAYNVKFDSTQLTNPAYNTQLGEAHLRELIDSYNGSYFLSLAAYNAGGGRVADRDQIDVVAARFGVAGPVATGIADADVREVDRAASEGARATARTACQDAGH